MSVLNFQTSLLMPKPKASELGRRKNVATLSELHGLVITVTGLSSVTMAFNSTHKTEKINKKPVTAYTYSIYSKKCSWLRGTVSQAGDTGLTPGQDQPGYRYTLVYKVKMN